MRASKMLVCRPASTSSYREEYLPKRSDARRTRPIRAIASRIVCMPGSCTERIASIATTPAERAASRIERASASQSARGFSTSTCLPARTQSSAWAAWRAFGLAM